MFSTSAKLPDSLILLGAAVLLCVVLRGFATGNVFWKFRTVKRSEDGFLYWFAMSLYTLTVLGCIYILISHWCHKLPDAPWAR